MPRSMTANFRRNRNWLRFVLAAILVIAILGIVKASSLGDGRTAGASTSSTVCAPNVPAVKCNPPTFTSNPTPPGGWPDPVIPAPAVVNTVNCGATFFSAADEQALASQFGVYQCELFVAANTWVVVGSGGVTDPSTPNQASPGGSMIATEQCAPNDATCLSPTVTHPFSNFTVSYPPDTETGGLIIQALVSTASFSVYDYSCGLFIFDIASNNFYPASASNFAALTAGNAPSGAVAAPAQTNGSVAETALAPASVSQSCPPPAQ
jgi:hypothetical protein